MLGWNANQVSTVIVHRLHRANRASPQMAIHEDDRRAKRVRRQITLREDFLFL
jgi:hypothetical protein